MTNMFDYIKWRGDISFDQLPLNKIDALIFAQLSYTNLQDLVSQDFSNQITLKDLSRIYAESPDFNSKRNTAYYKRKRCSELLMAAGNCNRFSSVKICGLKQILDEQIIKQFSAMVFIAGNTPVIAITGTDDTIAGWKEDFLLSFTSTIPSHKEAIEYLKDAADYFKTQVIIAGHSKGGNVAINTAVNCGEKYQKKIKAVYNFDGPGFKEQFFKSKEFKNVESKITSIYPENSIVGMIFHHPQNFEITKSAGKGLDQHKCHLWNICGADFIHEIDFSQQSKIFYESLNTWSKQVTPKQAEELAHNLFSIVDASGAKTVTDLTHIKIKSIQNMISAYNNISKSQSEQLKLYIKTVSEVAQDSILLTFRHILSIR